MVTAAATRLTVPVDWAQPALTSDAASLTPQRVELRNAILRLPVSSDVVGRSLYADWVQARRAFMPFSYVPVEPSRSTAKQSSAEPESLASLSLYSGALSEDVHGRPWEHALSAAQPQRRDDMREAITACIRSSAAELGLDKPVEPQLLERIRSGLVNCGPKDWGARH